MIVALILQLDSISRICIHLDSSYKVHQVIAAALSLLQIY